MAKNKCSTVVSKRVDKDRQNIEDLKATKPNVQKEKFTEHLKAQEKSTRTVNVDNRTFMQKVKESFQKNFAIKYDILNKPFKAIENGVEKTTNFSYVRSELMALASSSGEAQDMVVRQNRRDYDVSQYDENGNILERKKKTLDSSKILDIGILSAVEYSLDMKLDNKDMYFRDKFENQITNPEEEFTVDELEEVMPSILEKRQDIQDDMDLWIEQLTDIEKANQLQVKMIKYAKTNRDTLINKKLIRKLERDIAEETNAENIKKLQADLKNEKDRIRGVTLREIMKNISEEQQTVFKNEINDGFQHQKKLYARIQEEAKNRAWDKNFEDFLKFDILPDLKAKVYDDPQTLEAYENGIRSDKEIQQRLIDSYLAIGRDVSNLLKHEHYMKALVQGLVDTRKFAEGTSPLGVDLSMFVGQKGSTRDILTDIRLSRYIFHLGVERNIFNAKAQKIVLEHNANPEIVTLVNDQIEISNQDVNKRLLDTSITMKPSEVGNLEDVAYNFNNLFVENGKYADLAIDYSDIKALRKFRDKNGIIQEGSINEEIKNNINVAIESEKNQLKVLYLEREFTEFFKNNPGYKDVEQFLNGREESINIDRLYKFAEMVNATVELNLNKQNTLAIKNLVDMNGELNYNILGEDKVKLNKLIKRYLYDDEGNERYVLTDFIGNKLGYNQEHKIGSLYFDDFDADNPTAFAEWLSKSMFLDADINMTTDFIAKDKVLMLPKPLADTLAEMKTNLNKKRSNAAFEVLKNSTSMAKVGMLYNPFSVIGYNMRNAVDDTRAVLISQPQAFKELFTDTDIFNDISNFFLGKETSQEFVEFLRHTDTFASLNQDEIMRQFKVSDVGKMEEIRDRIIKKKAELMIKYAGSKGELKGRKALVAGKEYFKFVIKGYMGVATHVSSTREIILRYAVYKSKIKEFNKTYNETGIASTENWGASKKQIIQNILDDSNAQTDIVEKEYRRKVAAMEYANESLISYRDASHFVDGLSKWAIPFARYSEGNIRRFSRLMENFVYDMHDSYNLMMKGSKWDAAKKASKTTSIAALRGGVIAGVPMIMFNAAMLALQGMDFDDIPDYHKENGFTMIPPILNIFGYDQALMISNSDNFAEMLSIVGLDEINYKLQDAFVNYAMALTDEELETDLLNDMLEAFTTSEIEPGISLFNKALGMSNPFVKAIPELAMGIDYYPEGPVSVGYKYSKMENVVRKAVSVFGLGKAYTFAEQYSDGFWKMVFGDQDYIGTPRGMDLFESVGVKSIGTKQDSWQQQRSLAYSYSEDILGKEPFSRDMYGDERDYLRDEIYQQLKFGKYENTKNAIDSYITYLAEQDLTDEEMNKEMESLRKSLKSKFDVIPSTAISKKEMPEYIASLSQQQINDLLLAYEFQREIVGPYYGWIFGD